MLNRELTECIERSLLIAAREGLAYAYYDLPDESEWDYKQRAFADAYRILDDLTAGNPRSYLRQLAKMMREAEGQGSI